MCFNHQFVEYFVIHSYCFINVFIFTIRETLGLKHNIIEKISIKRLRYYGHVQRMNPQRYPKVAIVGNVNGKRPRGRPAKRWMDGIWSDCDNLCLTSLSEASRRAQDRKEWQKILRRMASLNKVGVDAIK